MADADTLLHLVPPTVREEARLAEIVRSAASDPVARSAFVVDDDERLLGVVPVSELDRDLLTLMMPTATSERLSGRQLARLAHGTEVTARQLMCAPAIVHLDETLAMAVQRMQERGLESAAVLDAAGNLLGYVAIFEILADVVLGSPASAPTI